MKNYPVKCGIATQTNPKLPVIQKPSDKPRNEFSYNNKGINEFLGFTGR